jgi:flavin reductase (DIM6/NTAB) family NADH-FMN oxidoreductase RutF
MRNWITSVAVITTSSGGSYFGFTSNSFHSVSIEPPLISFCLAKKALSLPSFMECSHFGVSILAQGQEALIYHFAKRAEDKFKDIDYIKDEFNNPLIHNSSASISCEKYASHPGGDHVIFIGRVLNMKNNSEKPLIYDNSQK